MELTGLSEKIFIDRYAMKDVNNQNLKIGDTVNVVINDEEKNRQTEVGEVTDINDKIQVKLRNGEVKDFDRDKIVLVLENTPDMMWDRLAREIASVEKTEEKQKEWEHKFRNVLDDWRLVPGGRIAAGAGANDEYTLFNCYVLPSPKDSRKGIMDVEKTMTEVQARGGGTGINISSLRPRRAIIKKLNGSSSGAVSWGELFSFTTGLMETGGSRRGALLEMLWDWHPDILEFITVKQDSNRMLNANLSVGISNAFMEAVKNDLDWDLVFPDTNDPEYDDLWDGDLKKWKSLGKEVIVYKTLKARELWDKIIESAWKSAEPGIIFMEYYDNISNSWYFNPIVTTNPCATH